MFRKFLIAAGATATLAAAALAPTSASAFGWHGHHGHGGWHRGWHGPRFYAPAFVVGSSCYIVKRVVETPYGPRVRRVTVCD